MKKGIYSNQCDSLPGRWFNIQPSSITALYYMTVLLWLISCPEIILNCVLIISKYQDFCTFCMFFTVSFHKLYWMCGLIVISVIHYVLNVHVQYICCFYRELMKLHAYMTDKVCDWFQNIIFFSVMIKETSLCKILNSHFYFNC